MERIRVRFPPSPTGFLHIGNARTALFNYLFSKHHGGDFVFRIEDTDTERSKEDFVENEIESLKWLGLKWDEGPEIGGKRGPYRQSQRLDLYIKYVNELLESGKAYYCFCTSDQIDEDRKKSMETGEAAKYSGRCRNLSKDVINNNIKNNIPYSIRFKLPDNEEKIAIIDLIRGEMFFSVKELDDFIIIRSNGIPTYNFAVVIDDHLMEITHILRGEDHLFGNTPRQLLLYKALNFRIPHFAHFPMILGSDKTKLSKRHGAFAVTDYKNLGFLPQAIVNYMALLGWSPKNDREFFELDELIEFFDITNINLSPAVFDYEKLKWFNAEYLRRKTGKELLSYIKGDLEKEKLISDDKIDIDRIEQTIELSKSHFTLITDILPYLKNIWNYNGVNKENLNMFNLQEAEIIINSMINKINEISGWNVENIYLIIKSTGKENNLKGKSLYHPLRICITNEEAGLDLNIIIFLLGKKRILEIFEKVLILIRGV